jgi:hypothetical protein
MILWYVNNEILPFPFSSFDFRVLLLSLIMQNVSRGGLPGIQNECKTRLALYEARLLLKCAKPQQLLALGTYRAEGMEE